MTKQLLISIAAALPLLAQIPPAGNAFQNGWLSFPVPTADAVYLEGQSGPVLGRPLSATEVRRTEQQLSDGSHINHSETEHFYRDSVGRMRTETATGAVIFDPVAGFTYDLTTSRKTYTKSAVRPNAVVTIAAAAHRSSTSSHSGQATPKPGAGPIAEDLPPQFLNGVYVKGARVTTTIPFGAIGNDRDLKVVNERWYSDDLKLLLKSSNSDPRFGVTTYELTDISQTPPDPALFQIPAGYTEGH
jgi:hypothetical protein